MKRSKPRLSPRQSVGDTVLPVSSAPSVRAFHFYAFPVSILEAQSPRQRDWILANFIHLVFDPYPIASPNLCFWMFDYKLNPHLRVISAEADWIPKIIQGDFASFVHAQISNGWYIYLNVDEFFIPHRLAFNSLRYSHDVLIHGSSASERMVDLLGYDENIHFRSTRASWDQLNLAYQSHLDMNIQWGQQFVLYKYRGEVAYCLDERATVLDVHDYLTGVDPERPFRAFRYTPNKQYGLAAVHAYLVDLQRLRDAKLPMDLHAPQLLHEHSRLMIERLSRLLQQHNLLKDQFLQDFAPVARFYLKLKLAILAANSVQDYSLLDRLLKEFPHMVDRQRTALEAALAVWSPV